MTRPGPGLAQWPKKCINENTNTKLCPKWTSDHRFEHLLVGLRCQKVKKANGTVPDPKTSIKNIRQTEKTGNPRFSGFLMGLHGSPWVSGTVSSLLSRDTGVLCIPVRGPLTRTFDLQDFRLSEVAPSSLSCPKPNLDILVHKISNCQRQSQIAPGGRRSPRLKLSFFLSQKYY